MVDGYNSKNTTEQRSELHTEHGTAHDGRRSLHHTRQRPFQQSFPPPPSLRGGTLPRMQKPVELCSSFIKLATVHRASKTDPRIQRCSESETPALGLACLLLRWRVLRGTSPASFLSGKEQHWEGEEKQAAVSVPLAKCE